MYQNYRLFKISFLILCFFCWGCQQEELQPIQKEPEQGIFFKEWTYQEFTSIPAITNFLKGKKNGEFSSKITEIGSNGLEMEYDFYIDHSRVVEIQNRGITSFTMAIKRDYETAGYFENLMIDIDSSQTVHAYIVKYIPHEEVQDVPVHESFSFRGEISVVPIEFLGSIGKYQKNHQKASETICGSTPILICSYGSYDHIAGDECIKQEARTNDGRVTTVWIPNDCNDGGGVLYDGSSYPTNEGVHESGSDGSSTGTTTPILNEDDDAATALTNILEITNQRTIDWLNANLSKAQEICNFLNSNNQSKEAKDFANAAIGALMEGGQVDFEDRIIIESSFKTHQRLKCVYDEFKTGTSTIAKYLNNFLTDNAVGHLNLKADNNFASSYPDQTTAGALTEPPVNGADGSNVAGFNINIVFNTDSNLTSSAQNFSTIMLAQELIHEMVHAEMYRKLLECAHLPHVNYKNYTNEQWKDFLYNLRHNYEGLHDYFMRYKFYKENGQLIPIEGPTESQHQQMASHYRNMMIAALKDFDNNQHSDEFYNAIAWAGLKGTKAWNDPTVNQSQINSIITNAISNETHSCTN